MLSGISPLSIGRNAFQSGQCSIGERNLKKINDPVRNLKGRKKTQIVDQIRVEQESLPKSNRYKVGDILK
ncbi:hypothetical protein, partial [Oenococcus oeni]